MKISKRKLKQILPVIIGGTILSTSLVYAADHTITQSANSGEMVVLGDGDTIIITDNSNAIKINGGEMSGKDIHITSQSNITNGDGILITNGGKLILTGTDNKIDFLSTGQSNSAIDLASGSSAEITGMTGTYDNVSTGGFFLVNMSGASEAKIANSNFTIKNGMFATLNSSAKLTVTDTDITVSNNLVDMPTHVFQISTTGELIADGITVTSDIETNSGYIIANGYLATVTNSTLTSTKGQALIATSEDGSKFTGDNLTLNFNRNGTGNSYAISASGKSLTSLKNSTLNVVGDALLGIYVLNKGTLQLDNTKVDATGSMYSATTGTRGIQMQTNGSTVEMTNGTEVIATGFGVYSSGAGTIADGNHHTIVIDDSSVTSTKSWGSQIQNGEAQITLTGANASLQGAEGFGALNVGGTTVDTLVNVAVTDSATLNGNVRAIGAGKAATLNIDLSNSGNLIGDAMTTGADSSLNLKMESGSVWTGGASGDAVSADISDSQWNMTKDSTVKALAMGSGSLVVFDTDMTGNVYGTLTVADLSGDSGNFTMRTDIVGDGAGNNDGDFIHVTGTSAGDHTVTVQNNGAANATGDETLTIIRTEDGVAKFTNTNTVELGGYEFNLRDVAGSDEKEWELYGSKKSTSTASAAINIFAGSYLLNYAETQTLMQRMGDLRDGKEYGNVWGRIYGGKFHSDSDSFLKDFDMKYMGVQVGADKKFVRKDGKGVVYLGGFFGYTKGDIDYGYGSGDIDSKSLGAYWTHMHHNGFYADAVLKYGWMENDFDVLDSQGAKVTGDDISTQGFSGSLEVGRRYHFDQKDKDGWYIEPQAQVTISHQNGDSFTASNGLNIKVDSFRSVMGRLGAHVGYEVKGGKNPINIYGKASVVKEFDGDVDYSFNGSPETTSYKDTWVVYGVGATAKIGTRHNLYLDVERATGGQFTQSWALNGGYRYSW